MAQANNRAPFSHYPAAPPREVLQKMEEDGPNQRDDGAWAYLPGLKNKPDRQAFVVKVYGILFMQTLVTLIFIFLACSSPNFEKFQQQNFAVFVLAFLAAFFVLAILVCVKQAARTVPYNYLLLLLFTLAGSYVVAAITEMYTHQSVIIIVAITCALFLGLTSYAFSAEGEVNPCFSMLWTSVFVSFMSLALVFVWPSRGLLVLGSAFMSLWFGGFIVYDTKVIVGGSVHGELGYDEYIVAALLLYVDIITLFIRLLELFGERK